ncbi:hypothetical protein J0383_12970 [Flavobacterium endoglycinae]|uniref:Uncharacterized protein n=1 Tax=Flavobacterium endoglycinae TaxID=2816357 RepID=A0ABX7Q953_9FLAO|nr:hypothetical protein [Flavobacterium endoglycinae]QSW87209.1 hypothetical protein J0383_12970 [Flavobacterium endoglycinae]
MKTIKWLILGLTLLFALSINAQNKIKGIRITMQFEDEANAKTYECNNSYFYKRDESVVDNKLNNYDMSLNCAGTPDQKQLEWFSNRNLKKSLKITIFKSGKKEREYLLKNASVVVFSESGYSTDESGNSSLLYDISLLADQVFIDGISMKETK